VTSLLRLYPAGWRARYAAELEEILEHRALTPRDQVDLLLGAIDAHLHPWIIPEPRARVASASHLALADGHTLTVAQLLELRRGGRASDRRLRRLIALAVALGLLEMIAWATGVFRLPSG
jgi:hypothetical protein